MKKIFLIMLSVMCALLCACSNTEQKESNEKTKSPEIAFICDIGDIQDKSYNMGIWKGIEKYAKEKNIGYAYYKSVEKNDLAAEEVIKQAVDDGAKTLVTGGPLFEKTMIKAKEQYPNIKFIAVDCVPIANENDKVGNNVESISFSEKELGYLAGYSAVKEGFKNIGFAGGVEIPAIRRFSLGFMQGMNDAAKDMNLEKKSINVKHIYLGSFEDNDTNESTIGSWYDSGTQVVFIPAGGASTSAMKAAEKRQNKYVIGVDIDQSSQSPTVITSAMKNLEDTVYHTLANLYDNKFDANKVKTFGVSDNGVLLEMEHSKFTKFSKEDYNKIYSKLSKGSIDIKDEKQVKKDELLKTEYLNVKYIK